MISSNDRLHYQAKAKLISNLRRLGASESRFKVNIPFSDKKPCTCKIWTYSPTKRRYDPPNFYPTVKALIDGMTDSKVWTDDNYKVIRLISFEHGGLSGNKNYKIEFEIKEFEND
jgi:crossover junction endodeoxyribonuclease RusA